MPQRWEAYERRLREAVANTLRPELRNRLQKELVFYPLGREVIAQIIDKIIGQVNARLAHQGLRVELVPSARAVLMARGYSAEFGARAMERTIHDLVEEPLGRLILQGQAAYGQRIRVQGDASTLTFEVLDPNMA
jgi:ATP-dependent Clp protease ATP-binding subunit ClpC